LNGRTMNFKNVSKFLGHPLYRVSHFLSHRDSSNSFFQMGNAVILNSINNKFYTTIKRAENGMLSELNSKGYGNFSMSNS